MYHKISLLPAPPVLIPTADLVGERIDLPLRDELRSLGPFFGNERVLFIVVIDAHEVSDAVLLAELAGVGVGGVAFAAFAYEFYEGVEAGRGAPDHAAGVEGEAVCSEY